jgi:transcriptional repressor NrdR
VLESRRAEDGASTRRRRVCSGCSHRFTTYERREREPAFVRKRDGERQRFDRTKLRAALLRSTHKRQVTADDVEALVSSIELAVETAGGELEAARIGELALAGLGELDEGAYLQFLGTMPAPNTQIAEPEGTGSVRDPHHRAYPAKTAG